MHHHLHHHQQRNKPLKPSLLTINANAFSFKNLKLFSIFMASLLTISLSLFLIISISSSHHHQPPFSSATTTQTTLLLIQQACKSSRDPPTCQSSISDSTHHLPSDPTIIDIIQSAISISSDAIIKSESMVNDLLAASIGNLSRVNAAKTCLEVLNYAGYRVNLTRPALQSGRIKDARAWLSAAMVYQYDCWSALKYVNVTSQVAKTMSFLSALIGTTSDAGGMIANYDNSGDETGSWAPVKTERDGFWEVAKPSGGLSYNGGFPVGLKHDVTVCGGGGCDFEKVQEAVDAAPADNEEGRFVIYIKTGVYEETIRVPLEKKNVVFLGDGIGKTVITGSSNAAQPGMATINTATVGVIGDGFMASGLTIQNTAGPGAHQAVAFRSDSDRSVIENCEFLGNQDTLYAHALRQYYKSCRIQGNVDFIFGNSAAVFHDCVVLVAPRLVKPEKGESNAVTAHGRIDPVQSSGFVFYNCVINGTEEYMSLYYKKPSVHKNFLGRPWKEYSRTVFINCTLEAIVKSAGWMPWKGDFALKTLYYGEYENTGPGADTSGRVAWSSLIPAQHIDSYSVQNFIQGNEWIPTL